MQIDKCACGGRGILVGSPVVIGEILIAPVWEKEVCSVNCSKKNCYIFIVGMNEDEAIAMWNSAQTYLKYMRLPQEKKDRLAKRAAKILNPNFKG